MTTNSDNQIALNGEGQEEFILSGYNNKELRFKGRLFSEGSFFAEESGSLTKMRLFILEDKRLVYSVVSGTGTAKDRRVYILEVENKMCHIDNGQQRISLPVEMLFTVVCGLCGLNSANEAELKATLEESLMSVVA